MADRLNQRVALVTGGARGLGKQIAITLAKNGADIVIADLIDMDTTASEVKKLGRKALTVKTDVTKKSEVERLFDTAVASFGKVDILVNDAGVTRHSRFLDLTEEDWDMVLAVNLKGAFLCTQAAAKHMLKQKYGRIINISSVAAISSRTHGSVNYQCAKGGVIQLTKASARELGPYGITVNSIAPGLILTDMTGARRSKEQVEQMMAEVTEATPLRRMGVPQDIANVALFLASDESSFVTGQTIVTDGGWG